MSISGKIYALKSPDTDKIYIGSTSRSLSQRWGEHKADIRYLQANNPKKGYKKTTATEITKYGNAYIELIEEFKCESREDLLKREREIILKHSNCVNRADPITQSLSSLSSSSLDDSASASLSGNASLI